MWKGVRQGCPLSPLLFNLVMEVLALRIRENDRIHGIYCEGKEFEVTVYADEIVCSLTDPVESMRELGEILDLFGRLYLVNPDKSVVMEVQIGRKMQEHVGHFTKAKWKSGKVRYLGWLLSKEVKYLFEDNITSLMENMAAQLKRWAKQKISWTGRIAVKKIRVMPIWLFFFHI